MNKTIIITAVILISVSSIFAGGQQEDELDRVALSDWLVENTEDHITVIDSAGNEVRVQKPVDSMIADGMGEIFTVIRALKAEETVAASSEYVSRNKVFFPVIANLPPIGMGGEVDYERIISLNPDFICLDPYYYPKYETIASELPIVQLSFNDIESIRILGAILDREDEADEFINWIEGYTTVVEERVSALVEEDLQDVFFYYGGSYGMSPPPPYGTFGKDNYLRNHLIKRAGGRSLSREIPGEWVTVDAEWIVEQNPPLIIRECYILNDNPEMGYSVAGPEGAAALIDNIYNQAAFESSDAVKNKNVHLIYGDLVTDSWYVSLIYLAKWVHPGLFEDLDPLKMHQEFLTRFQRLDFDVSKQGVFAYSAE